MTSRMARIRLTKPNPMIDIHLAALFMYCLLLEGFGRRASIPPGGKEEVAQPAEKGVAAQHGLLPGHEIAREPCRVGKKFRTRGEGLVRIQIFDYPRRVADHHAVGRHRIHHNGPGADNAVLTDGNALADNGAVPDPNISFHGDRPGLAEGEAVVNAVPVRIGDIGAVGNHAVVGDGDAFRAADAHSRADQAVVADGDVALARLGRPDGKADLFVRRGDHRGVGAQADRRAEELHVPGAHEGEPRPQMVHLGPQEVARVKLLEFQIGLLDHIGSMILGHRFAHPAWLNS
ncbi:hypothetical protein DESC_740196 [Desulfosarcina cetonica]|nr:hypothetical protein DESC_740196 [Desulfosarcina cetonica]